MPFPEDWEVQPDGSMGPPKKPKPRRKRGENFWTRNPDGEDDPEVLARRTPSVGSWEEEFRSRPTLYRGIQMRSRIEARWAVVFDYLKFEWEYEPEHYELPIGNYLPDFWLRGQDCWVEIKGPHPTEFEQAKARGLARISQKVVYIFCCGIPRIGQDGSPFDFQCKEDSLHHGYRYNPDGTEEMGWMLGVKECCGAVGFCLDGNTARLLCDCDPSSTEFDEAYLRSLQVGFLRGRKARWD